MGVLRCGATIVSIKQSFTIFVKGIFNNN